MNQPIPIINDRDLGCLLDEVQKPARYIGGELGQVHKDLTDVTVRVCLAFPDAYEIGMSHLGLRILYDHLNRDKRIWLERAFCPFPDMEKQLRDAGLALFSIESRTPLHEFDVVGFSLQSEMTHTNLLTILDLGGIPLHRWERRGDDPIIVAGGPVAFNPEPLSDFVDAFLVGDGEEAFRDFLILDGEWRAQGIDRAERLARLASEVTGFYVPALYATRVDEATGFVHVVPTEPAPYPVVKALLDDVNAFPFPAVTLVPQCDIVHDRVAVEIARGCTEGCRFCQAGIIYRPVRERTPASIVDTIVEGIDKTGYEEASLTALSTADYSCITPLAKAVMAELQIRRTAMSVSSLRVYGVTEELAHEIARVRKTGFTIAPEAGSQRLRDVVNKGITDENIDTAAEIAFANGWTRLKMYFMIGLPTETDEDVLGIAEAAIRVWRIGKKYAKRKLTVVVSVSSHIPKAHSTFQWVPFDDPDELRRKQAMLAERLRPFRGIELKTHEVRVSRLEAVFSRGDRRLGQVIETAWRKGARFDEWGEWFREEIWNESLEEVGIDPSPYLDAMPTDEPLIWDHIDSRVTKEYLLKDLKNGLASRFTYPCEKPYLPMRNNPPRTREGITKLVCYDCGVDCDLKAIAIERDTSAEEAGRLVREKQEALITSGLDKVPAPVVRETGEFSEDRSTGQERGTEGAASQPFPPTPGPLYRYRICFTKGGLSRYLSHLEVVRVIERAGRRAGWPVAYSGGFHPHAKLSFGPALPVGVAGENEYYDVELTEDWSADDLFRKLAVQFPEGFSVVRVISLELGSPTIDALAGRFEYLVSFDTRALPGSVDDLEEGLRRKLANGGWLINRVVKRKRRTIDAAEFVADWRFSTDNGTTHWHLTLQSKEGRSVKPRELVESLLGEWPKGTTITRRRMGRLSDGRLVTPMEAVAT